MTLEDAIKHAEEVAEDKETRAKECIVKANSNNEWLFDYEVRKLNEESVSCAECAAEHRQLAEWLKELKKHRKAWLSVEDAIERAIDNRNMRGENNELLEWVSHIIDKAVKGIGEQDE